MFGRLKSLFQSGQSAKAELPTGLASDPRWQKLNNSAYRCTCCNRPLPGVFDIGYDHPGPWPHGNREKTGQQVLIIGDDALGTDFCEHDGQFYIRCILPLPIIGSDQNFAFGPWASLSEDSKSRYAEADKTKDFSDFQSCFGWMCNILPGFDGQDPLPATVQFGDGTMRPELWIHEGAHPLADAQRDGITFDQLLDIYAASGNDLRPHLLSS